MEMVLFSSSDGAANATAGLKTTSAAAANASRIYGDANPLFGGTLTGIKNADNITATYTTTTNVTSAVGTYPILANLISLTNKLGNYTITKTDGVLTIIQAPLTVTAASVSPFASV